MDYVNLGRTGLKVFRLCLGCMTYDVPEAGTHAWTLNEAASRPFIQQALEAGINHLLDVCTRPAEPVIAAE